MTIKPAAGPLIVSSESLTKVATKPPTMAVMIPAIAGYPEASDMPKQSGNAIRNTKKPEMNSSLAAVLIDTLENFSKTVPGTPVIPPSLSITITWIQH